MALYQPTDLFPDLRSGLGRGCVDASSDLTVSWAVNGSSALVAYQCQFYQNDADSTLLYSTGRVAVAPFYGTDPISGQQLFFSAVIPASTLEENGIVNGGEYKMVVTQWWGNTDQQSVRQSSASAFFTRSLPILSIDSIPSPLTTRYFTFTGAYSQAQGDVLNWFRFRLAYADDTDTPFFDTGNVFGTMDLRAYYDGLYLETEYAVRLTAQTEHGIEADTGWVNFQVVYDSPIIGGVVRAACPKGVGAVRVSWSDVTYIPGKPTGPYDLSDGILYLPEGSEVVWDTVNGGPMGFPAPWSVLWKGMIFDGASATLFSLAMEDGGSVDLLWDGLGTLDLSVNGVSLLAAALPGGHDLELSVILTPSALYLRYGYYSGGLYPAEDLYPAGTLYPVPDVLTGLVTDSFSLDYEQGTVASVTVAGQVRVYYLEILQGTPQSETLKLVWKQGTYFPGDTDETDYFRADFTKGLNAGNIDLGGETISGYALYRRAAGEINLTHVADTGADTLTVFDYGAVNNGGPYVYYLFPVSPDAYIARSILSNSVMVCDWNWMLFSCSRLGDKEVYQVNAVFRFGKNLSTGEMNNNNKPNLQANFTRYPTLLPSPQNYFSGTLTALIGVIDPAGAKYRDTKEMRNALAALSTTDDTLFLRSRKGDIFRVCLTAPVQVRFNDASVEQAQSVTVSWAEIGPADGVSLIAFSAYDELGNEAEAGSVVRRGQEKIVTPRDVQQVVTPDFGYDYLSRVIVRAVPYQEVENPTGLTAVIGED